MKKLLSLIVAILLHFFTHGMEKEPVDTAIPVIKGDLAFYYDITDTAKNLNITPKEYHTLYPRMNITSNTILTAVTFFMGQIYKDLALPLEQLQNKKDGEDLPITRAGRGNTLFSLHCSCRVLPGSNQSFSEIAKERRESFFARKATIDIDA